MSAYPARPRPRGFACPACRRPLVTEAVHAAAPGLRLRARLCPRCAFVVLTRETAVRGANLVDPGRKGFGCRAHPGRALDTTHVRRVGPGIVVRYLQCPLCLPAGHVCRHGPPRAGTPMVRTEERTAGGPDCATPLSILAGVCHPG